MSDCRLEVLMPITADITFVREELLDGRVVRSVQWRCTCGKRHKRQDNLSKICRVFWRQLLDDHRRIITEYLNGEKDHVIDSGIKLAKPG